MLVNNLKFLMCLVGLMDLMLTINCEGPKNKRALSFPASSTLGIFIAIAVPLELPNRNVFMSYNFEANYNLPFEGWHYIPGPLKRFENFEEERRQKRQLEKDTKNCLLCRKNVYKILEHKFKTMGFQGRFCLLRLICEVNSANVELSSGLLGTLFHIIFTPSCSKTEEDLDENYYRAEYDGIDNACNAYTETCPQSLLDLISVPVKYLYEKYY